MQFADARLDFHIKSRTSLDYQQILAIVFDRVAPSIDRANRADDVDAGRQPLADQCARDRDSLILGAGGHEYDPHLMWSSRWHFSPVPRAPGVCATRRACIDT